MRVRPGRGVGELGRGRAAGRARAGAPRARTGGCRWPAAASPPSRTARRPRLAGSSARAAGRSFSVVGPRTSAKRWTWPSDVGGLAQRARQLADGGGDVLLLGGERAQHGRGGVDEAGEVVVVAGQLAVELVQRGDQPAQVVAARGDRAVDAGEVAVRGLEAAEQVAQVGRAALQPAAGVGDQQPQVVARVGVERGEDLVRVDVRRRVLDRDRPVLLGHRRVAAAGLELDEHVLQAGLGPQQRGRVGVDEVLVLRVDVHPHDRAAVLELDLADVADPHAGDADGLALAGDHGLRGLELGVEHERLVLDDREAHPLLAEDVDRHAGGDDDQAEDGQEVLEVLADRELHGCACLPRSSR